MWGFKGRSASAKTFFGRLKRDVGGNTLAMMAVALVPLSALTGSAVDIGRLYVIKVRLQQACDAGVLAGRKSMTDATAATLDPTASDQAKAFFNNNFKTGWMQTNTVAFTPSKTSNNQVGGIASTNVPMTVMKMFGMADQTLSVSCVARYDVADTDVIFVLDTTGSMACLPGGPDSCGMASYTFTRPGTGGITGYTAVPGYAGSTGAGMKELTSNGSNVSRMEALRQAVLSFFDTFAAVADKTTHIRYGFVTYASGVNVGQAIRDMSSNYLVGSGGSSDTANYQSRRITGEYDMTASPFSNDTANNKTSANCTAAGTRNPSTALTFNSSGTATKTNYDVLRSGKCYTRSSGTFGPVWKYQQWPVDVSQLVSGSTNVLDPTKVTGDKVQWAGCVETPVDTPGQSTFTTSNLPSEVSPDTMPSGSSRWWPHLGDVEYTRSGTAADTTNGDAGRTDMNTDGSTTGQSNNLTGGYSACGKPVKRLGVMSRNEVYNYVYASDFVPMGGTYHDTGMIWGARLISPLGGWASDSQPWADHGTQPNRVIVFMTDGTPTAYTNVYSMYGLEMYDKRVANGDTSNLVSYHIKRFLAACAAAKDPNHKVSIWTVEIAPSPTSTMQSCATSTNQALATTTGQGLQDAFKSIAQSLAMLRITQ
ncbi:hypothetical protein ASG11_11400 [Sphingomonas sp. Leaf357]|uniref:TadE/TadG family type IV pilus assembly protein n=1 Tax=Sphingomonas sp. Leaf357 TaxID=1736350 RepID=UPI0006F259D5|nr:TadE/TadG family type IV pilus assembly protein [Sphingomonas sp. Leaf357]KQS04782.1 hypothetical protein ASG11_11400 [Sphingomonas sp. Leaf357]